MIPEIAPYNNYTGDGSTTQFDFDFYIEDASQLIVQKMNADGTIVTLTKDTDYSIHEVGNASGSYITFPIASSSYSKLASDEIISLMLTLPISQESEYGTSSELDLMSLEYSLDYLTRICQIMNRQVTRALKVAEGSNINTDELALDVEKIADISDDVSTVAEIAADVTAVKNNATNITTVAGSISNVDAVGGSIANVNTVVTDLTNIDTVAGSISNVNTVGSDIANVNAVAGSISNVNTIKEDLTNIDNVANDLVNINAVAGSISNVDTVAAISSDVTAVKNNATNINAVAADLTNINAVAADLTNIDAASSNAQLAKDWANKMNGTVDGYEYSAKYYAQQAASGQVQANWNESDASSKAYIWNKPTIPVVDQTYDGTSRNAQSGVAIKGAKFIRDNSSSNTGLGIYSLSVSNYSVAIGGGSVTEGDNSVVLGAGAGTAKEYSIAIGRGARCFGGLNDSSIIQLGYGANSTNKSFNVGFYDSSTPTNYQLLDGTTGLIPYQRLPYDNSTITVNTSGQLQAISRNIGEIVSSTLPLTDAGLHLLDGALISGSGSYSAFVDYIINLYYNNASIYYKWEAVFSGITYTTYTRVKNPTSDDYYYSTYGTTQIQKFAEYNVGNITWQVDGNGTIYYATSEATLVGTGLIGNVAPTPPSYFETEANWQTAVTTYGTCGKFVYDSSNNTVRLPKITGFVEGTIDITALGDLVEAGLPNITGRFHVIGNNGAAQLDSMSGAFAGYYPWGTWGYTNATNGSSYHQAAFADFDASRTSSLYRDNFNKVQPQATKVYCYVVIATTTKTAVQVDIDEIATDLNGKADIDLTNCTDVANIKMAHNAMPSDTYIDLTWGASGTIYTAPADGYFFARADAQYGYISFYSPDSIRGVMYSYVTGVTDAYGCYSIRKGDKVAVYSNNTPIEFRFIYAVGSESEAS